MNNLKNIKNTGLLLLAVSCSLFFIIIINIFLLSLLEKLIILEVLSILYILVYIFLSRFIIKLLIRNKRIKIVEKIVPKEVIREVPVIKEVIKKVFVIKRVKEKAPIIKKYKFYGSTQANTYHKGSCRFSGMIKKEHLLVKNTNDYFKNNKFRACKNCNPNKK